MTTIRKTRTVGPKPRVKSERPVGRPRGKHGNLRDRLIDTAITQFSRAGIRATSLRAIAQATGVTPAMLHYYFGDKPQMVQAMVAERLLPALAPVRARIEAAGESPEVLAAEFVRGIGELVARHSWLPPLWIREVLCEGGALREILFNEAIPRMPQLLEQRFATAQAAGKLDSDLDPRLLVVSLVGLTLFPAAGAPVWRRLFHAEDLDGDVMRRHTLALLQHGLGTPRRNRSGKRRAP